MSSSLRALRMLAALLAAVGLLARPARAVVLCPMEMTVVVDEAVVDEHAHHEGHEGTSNAQRANEGSTDAPAHEICPDLAHCAVAAPASGDVVCASDTAVRAEPVVTAHDRPASAISSLDPPPPKRR